jgi:hypothetical protein
VSWQTIDPGLLIQQDPAATLFWYRDDDRLRPGDLALWIDQAGALVRVQLAYTPAVGARELFLGWEAGGVLRTGDVQSDEHRAAGVRRSPLVRRRALDAAEIATLRAYVLAEADALPPTQRAALMAFVDDFL